MGMLYQGIGIDQEALKCYREAVKVALRGTADQMSYSLLASMELANGNKKEAFQTFNKWINLYPKSTGAYAARGSANLSFGNYKEAITDLNRAVDLSPTNSYAYYKRAGAFLKMGQEKKGLNDLRISARLGNEDAQKILKENGFEW